MSNEKTCPCGKPLHYADPQYQQAVERLIELGGEFLTITIPETEKRYRVSKHFIALHGVKGRELPELVGQYGIEELP